MPSSSRAQSLEDAPFIKGPIPFAIPIDDHLAKIHLERLDLFGELARVSRHEARRHEKHITGQALRPTTPKKSGGPFGSAKLPPKRSRSDASLQRLPVDEPKLVPAAQEKESPKKPGLDRGFVLPSNDPRDYHNPHDSRGNAVRRAVREQERLLANARSQKATYNPDEAASGPTNFRWDHVPIGFNLSESQANLFPRSMHATRTCGGGKDPKYTKPWQDFEKWREAKWQTENAMGRGKV